jgi:hypothetical protein
MDVIKRFAVYVRTMVQHSRPPIDRKAHRRWFWRRMLTHAGILVGVLGLSLLAVSWGYQYFEHLPWRRRVPECGDASRRHGPVKRNSLSLERSLPAFYALYSGLVVIAVTGLLLAPGVHHLMHHVHWDDTGEGK